MDTRYQIVGAAALHMAASEGDWADYGLGLSLIASAPSYDDGLNVAWARQVSARSVLGTMKTRPSAHNGRP